MILVNQAYHYELKLNNKQRTLLLKHSGTARFAYNWGLAHRITLFEQNKGRNKFTTAITQHCQLNALKKSVFPWMYEVSKGKNTPLAG
jgi:putative transposase